MDTAAFVILTAKLIGFHATEQFTWSLVTIEYWTFFLGLAFLYQVNQFIIEPVKRNYLVALTPLTLLFGSTVGQISVSVGIATLIAFALSERDSRSAKMCWLVLLVGVTTSGLIYWLKANMGSIAPGTYSLFSGDALRFVLYCFSQSLLPADKYPKWFGKIYEVSGISVPIVLGLVVVLLNGLAMRIYFKHRFQKITLFPLFFLVMSYIFIAGAIYGRFRQFGPEYAFQPRYVRLFDFNSIAILWILLMKASLPEVRVSVRRIILSGGVGLTVIQLAFIPIAYKSAPWIIRYHNNEVVDIRRIAEGKIQKSDMPRLAGYQYKEVIDFLKAKRLSLFTGEF